jgi:cation diffusion facilitator family transporter
MTKQQSKLASGRRVAGWGIFTSVILAVANITVGLAAGSTSVVAAGAEFAGDVLASVFVLLGMTIAVRPPDDNHPYGHGRYETLAGFLVGIILFSGGVGICWRSLQRVGEVHAPPGAFAIWPLVAAVLLRGIMATIKFRVGRRIKSASLIADAWNDSVDILSAGAALAAVGLTLMDPVRFLSADHYGGFAVGIAVAVTGLRILRDTSMDLTDATPAEEAMQEIRVAALSVPGVEGIEKCFARNSGLQVHVELHVEVDPRLTVGESHEIAGAVRTRLKQRLDWIADVLVHVEPKP